jgi:hypothetical protein
MIRERNPLFVMLLLTVCVLGADCKINAIDYTGKGCEEGRCPDGYRCDDQKKCARLSDGTEADAGGTCPPYLLPPSCEAKHLSDSKNCCIPGRDCQGSACIAGMCQPIAIVSDATTDARAIRVTGNTVLWATGCTHRIRRCAKDGSGNVGLPEGKNCTPTLDVKGDHVYWIEYDGPFLNAARIDGSEASKIVAGVPVAGARADFTRLAVDDHNAYWAMSRPPSVWHAPLDGDNGVAMPLALEPSVADAGVVAQEPAWSPYGVAVDATHVYWSDSGNSAIKRRALTSLDRDLPAERVISGEEGPMDIALDGQRLYWLTSTGLVRSCDKAGPCTPLTLASGQTGAEFLLVDDLYVYWTTYVTGGSVRRVQKMGGRLVVESLATNQKMPYGIAQECGTIYWTNHNDFHTGEVMKVTK